MYSPSAYNLLAINPGMAPAADRIMPLRLLIRQGGIAGYLLLLGAPLALVTTRQRAEGYDSVDGSAAIQFVYTLACFLCAVRYLASPQNRPAARILVTNPVVFFLLYIVLCGVSTLWSPRPAYTAFMAFQCLAYLLLIVVALCEVDRQCSLQDVIEWVMMWVIWAVFWAITVRVRMLGVGAVVYPFTLIKLLPGAFFFLGLYLCRRRLFGWIVVAFTILSLARSNYFGLVPGLLCGVLVGDRKAKMLTVGCVGILIVCILAFGVEEVVQNTLFYGKEGIGWEYTTGRDKVFSLSWEMSLARPIGGYGFVAGERDILLDSYRAAISTHNMFFSAFMGVGFLGPVLLFLYFVGTLVVCLGRGVPGAWRFSFTATVFMVFTVSMTNPGLGGRVYGAWLPSMIVMTAIAITCRRIRQGIVCMPESAFYSRQAGNALGNCSGI